MATWRYVGYDLLTSLKKMDDDSDIRLTQVLYWMQVIANRISVEQFLATDSGLYTSTFDNVTILTDDKGRKYIDLPNQIMDLPNEEGVEMMSYCADGCEPSPFTTVFFQPTTLSKVPHLYMDEYTKPDTDNPYFYRVGNKVNGTKVSRLYLLGLDCIQVTCLEIAIRCTLDPSKLCDLDEDIPLPDERIEELMQAILQLGRFVMMIPEERVNEGGDETPEMSAPRGRPANTNSNTEQ